MLRPLVAILLAVYALIAAASFLPRAQLWGVNHLAFYSLPIRIAVLLLLGVAFLPPVARTAHAALLRFSQAIKSGGRVVEAVLPAVAVLSVVLFWTLRTSTNLLGDGQLITQSFEAAWQGNDDVVMRSPKAIVTEEAIAPGGTLAYYGAAKLGWSVFDKSPVWGVRLFICLLGAVFVYLLLRIARRAPLSSESRLWLIVLALFSSPIQLFFGYVEMYAPFVIVGFLYLIAGLKTLRERRRLWLSVVLFVVAVYTHIQSLLFAPSLLYLVVRRVSRDRSAVEKYAWPTLTMLTVVAAILASFTRFSRYYLPLRGDEQSYGLLSLVHLADIANELLLLMPVLPLLVGMLWINRSLRRSGGREKPDSRSDATAWFTTTGEWQYVTLILVPFVTYLLLFKPEIGMARDWDLFTAANLGLVPFALLVLNRFQRLTKTPSTAAFTTPAVAICVALTVAWVGINASPTRSTERAERILEYDRTHASYAYENLAIFYYADKNLDKAIAMMERATGVSHNPRQYTRLAMFLDEKGRAQEALQLMRDVVAKHPAYDKSRFYFVTQLERLHMWDELLAVSRDGTRYHPQEPAYWFYVGEVSVSKGDIKEGLLAYRKCLTLNPPVVVQTRIRDQLKNYAPGGK
jgi:hypothetical protein